MMTYKRLSNQFCKTNAIELAQQLVGKLLIRKIDERKIICKIIETEAYVGPQDKACHAYDNKRTKRTEAMFHEGGVAYIYLIYGMYNCLNVVANKKDKPEAVLIRAIEPLTEIDFIKQNRKIKSPKINDLTNGPGKLCKALLIDKKLNLYDLITGNELFLAETNFAENLEIEKSKRINIDYAQEYCEKLWRFYLKNNAYVSKI